ncbi:MAG: GFA family protein [Nevskiaceae bacterium]
MIHPGGCHCGNLRFSLETALPLAGLPLRACQCSFCRHHGARSTSDPAGRVRFEVRDAGKLTRYRFGLRTADFLICAGCGIYVGALMREGGSQWAIVNANAFDDVARLTQGVQPMDYEGEDAARRLARRKQRWSPAEGPG